MRKAGRGTVENDSSISTGRVYRNYLIHKLHKVLNAVRGICWTCEINRNRAAEVPDIILVDSMVIVSLATVKTI